MFFVCLFMLLLIHCFYQNNLTNCDKIELKCDIDDGLKCTFFNVHFTNTGINNKIYYYSNNATMLLPLSTNTAVLDVELSSGEESNNSNTDNDVLLSYPAEMKTYIEFIESQLEQIPPELFVHYSSVQEFVACGVKLQVLNELSFYGATFMERIDVSHNEISVLNDKIFQNISTVQRLDLSHNQIKRIEKGTFDDLFRLMHLDLSHNAVEELDEDLFGSQMVLEVLVLNNNKLYKIGSRLFANTVNLIYLSLEGNFLEKIDINSFAHLRHLDYLLLSHNHLTEFEQIHYAKHLYLSHNLLKSIIINQYTYVLDAQFNTISNIKCQSEMSAIEILLINNNALHSLHCIDSLSHLKILHAGTNLLQFVSKTEFQMLVKLELCNLNNNHISYISGKAFVVQKGLKFLDLSRNQLKQIDMSVFASENILETILLNDNLIIDLPTFQTINDTFPFLEMIDLSGNPHNCTNTKSNNVIPSIKCDNI